MSFQRLLTQHTSEAMHVQGNDGQSNRSGKSLSTFRPNTVEATVFNLKKAVEAWYRPILGGIFASRL